MVMARVGGLQLELLDEFLQVEQQEAVDVTTQVSLRHGDRTVGGP